MKKLFSLSLIICFVISCSNNENKQSATVAGARAGTANVDSIKSTFFPVTSFLKGQMILLDSTPVTILQITIVDKKTDSSWIKKEKLKPLLQPFIADIIDKENLTAFFKESKFNDQSTDAITFTYEPKIPLPDSIALRHWDIYIQPETGTVKRVYIIKQVKENNGVFTQQLTWRSNKWAKIVTIANKADGSSIIQNETKWVWDFNEERQ